MNHCKTLIRSSFSCLEVRARAPYSRTLCHFPSPLSLHIGNKFITQNSDAISRSLCCVTGALSFETSGFTDESTLRLGNDSVEELLVKNKDNVSRLMKLERRPDKDNGVIDYVKGERWFPYLNKFNSLAGILSINEVLESMDPYIMDARKEKFKNVVNNRTYSVCLVVEGLTDFGNVSAAFRSADALGIQSVHVVSCGNPKRYRDNRHVSMGAEKWLDIELWNSIEECFGVLKSRGYRIAVTNLGMDAVSVYDMDWSCPTAVVVGNELKGISTDALELADLHCSIPMRGMVDSFNVSVAAGLVMHQAVCNRTLHMGHHGDLTQDEKSVLLAEFYLRHSSRAVNIVNESAARKLSEATSKL